MLKALFRKQFLELNSFYFVDEKTGKHRSKNGVIRFVILYTVLYCYLGFIFYMAATAFRPLLETETPWLYATFMGLLSILYGVFGSAFSTYAGMYHAKDNDLLLSMPVPPSAVLLVRVSGVALMGLLYESMVWIPTAICRFTAGNVTLPVVLGYVLLLPVLTLLITVLSCFMGWVVALLASKLKNRSILTVVFALLFIGLYYFCFSRASGLLSELVLHSEEVGRKIATWMYPFYEMGLAAEGNILHLFLFAVEAAVLLGLTWFILTRTFIGIATKKESASKTVYREKRMKNAGADAALLRKEWKRFLGSPTYMLNAGLGSVMLAIIAVGIFLIAPEYIELMTVMFSEFTVILAAALLGMAASMNIITAPSISLEGKSLWVLRTMPVPTRTIFAAKQKLHVLYTGVPVIAAGVCLTISLKLGPVFGVLIIVTALAETFLCAAFGLFLNLKMPILSWTNETIPVKQSIATLIAMLSGMALTALTALGGYLLLAYLPVWAILALFTVVFLAGTVLLERWLLTRGVRIFEAL